MSPSRPGAAELDHCIEVFPPSIEQDRLLTGNARDRDASSASSFIRASIEIRISASRRTDRNRHSSPDFTRRDGSAATRTAKSTWWRFHVDSRAGNLRTTCRSHGQTAEGACRYGVAPAPPDRAARSSDQPTGGTGKYRDVDGQIRVEQVSEEGAHFTVPVPRRDER